MKNLSEKEIIKFLENSPHIQQQIDHYKEGQCYLLVKVNYFLVLIRNRLISCGLEPVISNTKKLCLASYYILFSTNIIMHNHMIKNSYIARAFSI